MNVDDDAFEIEDWEAYARLCINEGKLEIFKKKLSDYIYLLNVPYEKELREYTIWRKADFDRQDLAESMGKVYYPENR